MWNPYLIGVFMSLYRSGLYISYDYLTLIASELCPTSIRGSIIGAQSLCSYLAVAAGLGITTIVLTKGGLLTGYACLTVGIPFAAIGLFLAIFFLSESKGADLEAIK
jgi:sugar phosphate permease